MLLDHFQIWHPIQVLFIYTPLKVEGALGSGGVLDGKYDGAGVGNRKKLWKVGRIGRPTTPDRQMMRPVPSLGHRHSIHSILNFGTFSSKCESNRARSERPCFSRIFVQTVSKEPHLDFRKRRYLWQFDPTEL